METFYKVRDTFGDFFWVHGLFTFSKFL